nr:hypothetical protein [Tanacetum cinerariifolium]GEZ67583.1 hypothetical protein [Tanacetum cinerariifolium]
MASLADKAILSGADNRPPMLENDMYDSWKSRMELYMLNRQHGRMILESVEQGPLLWPSVEVEGVTRLKKYFELSAAEAIQADCDVKATNIIMQRLPPEVYTLVSTHKVAKELWERIQMLMQGMSLTKQEKGKTKSKSEIELTRTKNLQGKMKYKNNQMKTNPLLRLGEGIYTPRGTGHSSGSLDFKVLIIGYEHVVMNCSSTGI